LIEIASRNSSEDQVSAGRGGSLSANKKSSP
jgi:hypothetical protein